MILTGMHQYTCNLFRSISIALCDSSLGSYDATVRTWDCRARTYDPVQVMDEAKDSVTSLQLSASEILTGSVLMYCQLLGQW